MIFDQIRIRTVAAGRSGSEDGSAVGQTGMIPFKRFTRYEMNRRIIVGEISRPVQRTDLYGFRSAYN